MTQQRTFPENVSQPTALDEIRARLDAATPGPWAHDDEGFMGCGQVYTANEDLYGGNIAAPSGDLYPRAGYSPKDDMLFIAHAPADVARLLQALEATEGTLAQRAEALRATADRMLDEVMSDRTKTRQDHEDARRYVAYAAEAEAGLWAFRAALAAALEVK